MFYRHEISSFICKAAVDGGAAILVTESGIEAQSLKKPLCKFHSHRCAV